MVVDPCCVLYGEGVEDTKHLFFSCRFSTEVLSKVGAMTELPVTTLLTGWIATFSTALHRSCVIFKLRAAAIDTLVYCLWTARNKQIFEGKKPSVEECFFRIRTLLHWHWSRLGLNRS